MWWERLKGWPYFSYLLGAGFLILMIGLFIWQQQGAVREAKPEMTIVSEEKRTSGSEEEQPSKNPTEGFVDLKGEVKKPGVYPIQERTRLIEVIELAGGLTKQAEERAINFALIVKDQSVIYFPKIGEVEVPVTPVTVEEAINEGAGDEEQVNLNQATSPELESLPGIGQGKAAAIITYREENGPFNTVEDLVNVPGFGVKTVDRLKEKLRI